MEIIELLYHTKKNNASDLHLSSGHPPVMRIHGDIIHLKLDAIPADNVKSMIYSIMTENQRADYERDFELDFAVQFGDDMRFRVNAFTTMSGPAAAFRNIPDRIMTLKELGMPDIFSRLSLLTKGLILVTGPTGSGKSTTLAAMVDNINDQLPKHILTIEDPVEFIHKSRKALINQRELGTNTISFSRALKSALREDPDVILVGELRDLETIQLALTAAETGHLVLGTLHTNSAAKTIDRIIDAFPAQNKALIMSMLGSTLEAVISQTLIKKADGTGRVAGLEIMLGTPAIRNLIREGKVPQMYSLMQIGSRVGMRTMRDSINDLLKSGVITLESARSALNLEGESEESKNDAVAEQSAQNNKKF